MAGISDSSSGSGFRAGSLAIRRFGGSYQFEVDLPSPGGGVRPTIWSGTQTVDAAVWSALRAALEALALEMTQVGQLEARGTSTQVAPSTAGSLERLGTLMHRSLLPDEVKEELARYQGPLLLAADDPTLPWELLFDGAEFLGLRHAVGRRLVVSRRRRGDAAARPAASGGVLIVANPTSDLFEAEREADLLADLLAPVGACTVLKGPQANRAAVVAALSGGQYRVVHFAGPVQLNPAEPGQAGLVLADRALLTAADLESMLTGEPFVFLDASYAPQQAAGFLGSQVEALAGALAAGGARGFVGTVWPVYDSGTRQVAVEFYRRVVEAVPAGEALRQARATVRARRGDEPSWSAHVLYGDPGLLVIPLSGASIVTLRPRLRFGPFVLEEEVGRGGMGVVWKAYHPSLDRHVALKFLPAIYGEIDQSRERFKREARVVARLRHPNVLQVHDFGEEQGHLFLVTEYVPGGTLQDLLRREGVLTPERALKLLGPVASALDHLHSQNIIHRDVKPSNILLDLDGSPVLADCGVARLLDDSSTMTGTGAVVGTPSYMSPEQAAGHDAGPASDQYSFGVLMFEALTGQPPFEGRTPVATALAHLQQQPPSPRALNPRLGPEVEAALLRALAKRPEDRYPCLQAFVDALRGAGQEIAPVSPPIDAPTQSPTRLLGRLTPSPAPAVPAPASPTPAPLPSDPAAESEWAAAAARRSAPDARPIRMAAGRRVPVVPALVVGLALLAAGALAGNQLGLFAGPPAAPTATAAPAPPAAAANPTAPPTSAPVAPAAPTSAPAPTATAPPPTPTAAPPTATPLPPALADWTALLARLDGGLWTSDLDGASKELEDYVQRYQTEKPPQLQLAVDKLYAASIELGQRGVAAGDQKLALDHFTRASELRPGDPLAEGELKKVQLLLAGDQAAAEQRWEEAVASYEELVAIQASYGGAEQKLAEARAQLAATWTPTPLPAPAPRPQPQPQAPSQPAPRPQPAPAAPPTKPPFAPGTN